MDDHYPVAFTAPVWILGIIVLWVVPIYFGRRNLIRKGYSPHWMWFGIHPVFGYIALIASAVIKPRKECLKCGGIIAENFRICPHCGNTEFKMAGGARTVAPVPPAA